VAVEVIEQPNEWEMAVEPQLEETAESSAISFEPAESLSAAEQSVGIGDPPDETFGPVADTAQPAAEPTNEAVGVADEAAWPEAESTELADGDIAPVAERDEPVDEAVELFYEAAEPAGEPDPTQAESTSAPATDEERTEAGFESTHNDGAETEVEKVEQISFSDSLSLELDRMIAAGAKSVDMQMSVSEQGLVGELEVNGRKQHVYVQRSYSSNGAPLLSFFAACGPASQQHALPLLEWNSALPMCAFAIREIENTAMFVVQANVPAFSLNQMSITTTFKEIAKRADQVQQRIG
jgi:hypothetical protein